jgi:hypothetical protein
MDLKKFKNFTKSDEKTDKISFYAVDKYFNILKVVKVINYYTLEVIIYNRDKLNRWYFKLVDVDILDNKLNDKNRDYLTKKLEDFTLGKYLKFKVNNSIVNNIEGSLFFECKTQSSINILMINMTINLTVMRKKMEYYEKKEGLFNNIQGIPLKNVSKLSTIIETIEEEEYLEI